MRRGRCARRRSCRRIRAARTRIFWGTSLMDGGTADGGDGGDGDGWGFGTCGASSLGGEGCWGTFSGWIRAACWITSSGCHVVAVEFAIAFVVVLVRIVVVAQTETSDVTYKWISLMYLCLAFINLSLSLSLQYMRLWLRNLSVSSSESNSVSGPVLSVFMKKTRTVQVSIVPVRHTHFGYCMLIFSKLLLEWFWPELKSKVIKMRAWMVG